MTVGQWICSGAVFLVVHLIMIAMIEVALCKVSEWRKCRLPLWFVTLACHLWPLTIVIGVALTVLLLPAWGYNHDMGMKKP